MSKRIDPKKEAGRASEEMAKQGFESIFQKEALNSWFILWTRARGENVMTHSSAHGTRYYKLVDVILSGTVEDAL